MKKYGVSVVLGNIIYVVFLVMEVLQTNHNIWDKHKKNLKCTHVRYLVKRGNTLLSQKLIFSISISLHSDVADLWFIKKNISLKYQRFTPSGCKDIGIR